MVKKFKNLVDPQDLNALPTSLRESAQQIWMAGLSAFAKAQSGGNKVFEALMKEGQALPERTRKAARDQVDEMTAKAGGTWDKLEQVFETRVAQALHRLGVPTHDDIERLSRRVVELTALVETMQSGAGSGAAATKPAVKAGSNPGAKAAVKAASKAGTKTASKVGTKAPSAKPAARKRAVPSRVSAKPSPASKRAARVVAKKADR